MYILTGGAGFIGSVIAALLEDPTGPANLVIVDRLRNGEKWRNIAKRNIKEIIAPNDLMAYLDTHKNEVKAVIHMGAISSTTEKDADALMANNTQYSIQLFDWCTAHGKQFINASSAAAYGDGELGFNDGADMTHLSKLRQLNPFGFSKHLVDKYIVQSPKKPPSWVSLKFFSVYGPNEYHKGRSASVVLNAFRQIQHEGKVRLFKSHLPNYDDGKQMRDFIYVKDVARLIVWFIKNPQINGLFNIGTGKARTYRDLATATFKAMNRRVDIEYIDMPEDIRAKYQYFTEANMDKLQQTLASFGLPAFQFTPLEEGIADYVRNYLMTDDWYL